jgi:hypothetical protein
MICLLSTELYKCYAVNKDCVWLDDKDVIFNSYISVDNELATYGVYSIGELCFDYEGGGSCGKIGM